MKKVLITGSSGQSGREIARLLEAEYEIIGIDLVSGPFTTQYGDLLDRSFIDHVVRDVDIVIHTAALHAPHVATHTRNDFIETNIQATNHLLEASLKNGIERFVYTSTTSLYGESMDNPESAVWITEETPTVPRDIYDITKIAAEELCRDYFAKENLQTVVLRVSRFWDEPMEDKVFYRMYRGLDVRDVAAAHKLAIEKELKEFHIFNISAQPIFTSDDLHDLRHNLGQVLNEKIPVIIDFYNQRAWPLPEFIDRVYVIDKAKKILGYQPQFNIREMLNNPE